MRFLSILFCIGTMALVVTSCKTTEEIRIVPTELIGTGNLIMSARAQKMFLNYRSRTNPAYFAIAKNGRATGWAYCFGGPDACSISPANDVLAIRNCEMRTASPCMLFARGREIIWKGEIRYMDSQDLAKTTQTDQLAIIRSGMNPALKNRSIKEICQKAVDYAFRPYEWSNQPSTIDYVAEAKGRNVSIYQCAFETGHQ